MKNLNKVKEYLFGNQTNILHLLVLALLSIFAGNLILSYDLIEVIIILAGLCLAIVTFLKPQIGLLTIIAIISSIIFEEALPLIPIGIGSFHITDIILLFLLCMILFKLITDKNFPLVKTSIDLPLSLFYFTAMLSAFISIFYYKTDFNIVMRLFRHLTYYLIYFVITNLIQDKKEVKIFIKLLFTIAIIVAIVMIIQALVGETVQLMPGRVEALRTLEKEYSVTRILPPGQDWIYASFITAICMVIFTNKSLIESIYFYILIILGIGLLLTYNRNYWAAILISLGTFTILIPKRNKKRFLSSFLLIVILALIVTSVFFVFGGKPKEFIVSVSDRAVSLFAGKKIFKSSSLEWRKIENEYAMQHISKNPFFGIGLGNNYRPENIWQDGTAFYIHNGYLWIMLNMGLTGLLIYLWLYFCFLIDAFKYWKKIKDDFLKSAIIGFMLSGIGILFTSFVNPMFMKWYSIVVIATMMGLSEAIIKINKKEIVALNE